MAAAGSRVARGTAEWVALAAGASALALCVRFLADRFLGRPQARHAGNDDTTVSGLSGAIGNTPLIEIKSLSRATGCRVLAKAEFLNPGGSSKDRVALHILDEAEASGHLKPGGTVVEGTAGSTGISLALLARERGYRCVIMMPDDMAMEKATMLRTLGAEVKRVKSVSIVNNAHFCKLAEQHAKETPGGFFADQFENTANFRAHFQTTGAEIWRQTQGRVDAFVMAAGTGGTLAGVGSYLRQMNPSVQVALIDPPGSALYHKVASGVLYAPEQAERRLRRNRYDTVTEGIGLDRLTANFAMGLAAFTQAFRGTDQEAVEMAHYLLRNDGLFVGSSSAMNCVGVVKMARELGPGHTIVTCLCDSGQRSLSKTFNAEFLTERGLTPRSQGTSVEFVA